MIVAKMATHPARDSVVRKAIESLVNQVDLVTVYCNGHTSRDDLQHPKIRLHFGDDLGDGGKLFGEFGEYTFLVDDDLEYPPNYVENSILALETYQNSRVVGCHGAIMKNPVKNYFNDRRVIHYRDQVRRPIAVNVLGTGTLAMHQSVQSKLSINPQHKNMLDCYFAVACQKSRIGMISITRPYGWIKQIPVSESLWMSRGNGSLQTQVIQEVENWAVF